MKTYLSSFIRYTGVLLCSMLLLFSCSKDDGADTEPIVKTALVLTASATEIDKGDEVTFEVTAGGEAVVADIYIDKAKISGASHTFEEAGTYQVVAKKEGYTDSETIDIKSYQVDVYVAGSKTVNNRSVAVYWKNGTEVILSDGSQNTNVYSIFVDNGDVHVVGAEIYGGYANDAKYWKNGTSIELDEGRSATSVFVDNGNVYIAGTRLDEVNTLNSVAKYWKNGLSVDLSDGSQRETATAITVDNGDVYVAGTANKVSTRVAKYWKNGTAVILTDGTNDAFANSIAVDKGDVYVAGFESSDPKYWKNDTPVMLNDGLYSVYTSSMFVENGEVYIAGHGHESGLYTDVAKYWKNGVSVILTDGKLRTTTSSIFVKNGDIYVLGSEGGTPMYWKNGTPVILNYEGGVAAVNSIFVTRSLGGN